VKNNY